jgi:hypothetical protein
MKLQTKCLLMILRTVMMKIEMRKLLCKKDKRRQNYSLLENIEI